MGTPNFETVEKLRAVFNEMTESRRHLRPILSDIAASIDKGFFLDAGSEEVTILLKKILEAQEQFSEVEQVKRAAGSKKIDQVEKVISGMEQNIKRDELNDILAKIATLEVDSDNEEIQDAVKKVKLQAEHLKHKSSKMDVNHFAKNAEKFVLLAEVIDNENFLPGDYIKVVNAFQDNPLISMVLTQKIIHFPRPVEVEVTAVEESEEKISAPEKSEKEVAELPNNYRIAAILKKFGAVKPDLILMETDEKNFAIEKAQVKKQLTLKSFNKKLHELLDSTDPMAFFKFLVKARVFYMPQPKGVDFAKKFPKKLGVMVPTILEKLFNWGMADKIKWRGRGFYFLNETGMDICVRAFTRNNFQPDKNYFKTLVAAIQFCMLVLVQPKMKSLHDNFEFTLIPELPAARGTLKSKNGDAIQVALMFSVTLLGDTWSYSLAKIKIMIESELDSDSELKTVILFGFIKDDLNWLKIFDTIKFRQIKFFMYTLEGLFTPDGKEITFEDWGKICKFGVPSRKKRNAPKLPEPPDESPSPPPPKKKFEPISSQEAVNLILNEAKKHTSVIRKIADDFINGRREINGKPANQVMTKEELLAHIKRKYDLDLYEEYGVKRPSEVIDVTETAEVVEEKIIEPEIMDEPEKITEVKAVEKIPVAEKKPASKEIKSEEKIFVEEETDAGILTAPKNLFKAGETARGMLSLYALRDSFAKNDSDGEFWAEYLTREVGFILDDAITLKNLHNFDTFSFWTGEIEIPETNVGNTFDWLNLAAMIKNFYAPQNPTSYQIQKSWKQINENKSNAALKTCPAAKTLLSLFNNFTEKTHRAFADCLTDAEDNNEDKLRLAIQQIKNVENMADSVLHSEVNHRRVKDLIHQIFNNNGLIRRRLNVENFSTDEILNFCRDFESENLSAIISESGATIDEELFSENKIGDYIDDVWDKPLVHLVHGKNEPFKGPKRKKVLSVVKEILTALLNYVYVKTHLELAEKSNVQVAPVGKALEIISDLQKQISRMKKNFNFGQIIFRTFTDNLEKKLRGEHSAPVYDVCLLGAKYIELENDIPVLSSFGIAEFSLSNRVTDFEAEIKNKSLDENLKKSYETALKNYDCGVLQNLSKFYLAQLPTTEEDVKRKLSGLERQFDRQIERIYNEFLNDLELARNYSRITDQERIDFYINAAVEAKEHFLQTKNAGLFQRFINSCAESINKVSIPQRNALTKRLEKLEENLLPTLAEGETLENRYPILSNVHRQIDLMNLTVAEDYMNRLETEGGSLLTELDVTDSDLSTLEDFLSEYEVLHRAVNSANNSVESAFKQRLHGSRPNRETQNAIDFTRGWQGLHSGQNSAIEAAIIELLNHLGYGGGKISAQNTDSLNQKSYTVTFTEPINLRENYPHPFAVFGTEIYSKGLEIIYLGTSRKYDNIAQVLSSMTADRGTICFMDHAMTLPERRNLAKIMKLTPNLKNIIVIDKVMALYLARFDDANRGKKMLQTALPFARVQPYTAGGFVAPEMFIGRSEELDQIRDMSGPVFVYGGRQLGKSALLRQVRNIEHNPAQLNYAFFIDLKNLDSESTLKKIVYELKNAKLIGEVQTWKEFSFEMHKLLDGQLRGVFKPKKLLLLMDESDTFLSEKNSEQAIDILRELLVAFSGQFKFVLAGLHKVIRFEQNSSFGNLNHISVLPFRPSDAMELLVKPMSYLGFRIVDDSLISAIFSRTNYYPGSIQYYCKMLVDAVGNNYTKQKFDVAKNPPYALDDDYLKNMLGNREFQEEINQKFQITLHLDDDNYYEILALAVAMIYYEHNRPVGVDLTEIKNICLMCGVEKITRLSDAELMSLLDEMVALNLLRHADGKFEFNRYAFWHMMGTESEVNEKLDSYGINGQ